MNEILRSIANGIFIQQSVNIGSKLISDKRLTDAEKVGFRLSLLFVSLVNPPPGNRQS
jgi:hypothetical protein